MIRELIRERILILDGATGTMLQKYGDTPEMLRRIHREYIEAGADIIKRSQVLNQDLQLHIERSQRTIKIVHVEGQSFMQSLKDKLHWGK